MEGQLACTVAESPRHCVSRELLDEGVFDVQIRRNFSDSLLDKVHADEDRRTYVQDKVERFLGSLWFESTQRSTDRKNRIRIETFRFAGCLKKTRI